MNFIAFRKEFFKSGCFSIHQVYAWQPDFNKNNLTHWTKKGLLLKLRNGFYSFPEYLDTPGFSWFISNRIYKPSYISLHTALAFYGIIPESVIQITSVTTLKTIAFKNAFGEFSYKSFRENIMFGYEHKQLTDTLSLLFAQPEKAILDLLYLYPFYRSEKELKALRLDEDYLENELNKTVLENYTQRFKSRSLEKRVNTFIKIYGL